jgi:hypothetical protein
VKVRILLDLSDHVRAYPLGMVCELDDDQSVRWIEKGWAALVEPPETTTLEPSEAAVMPRPRKRRE